MGTEALIIAGLILAAAFTSVGIAIPARYVTKKDGVAIVIGGLALPLLVLCGLVYWLLTMAVDDPPPGLVIMGNLITAGVTAPIGFLASYIAVRTLTSRERMNDR